MSIDELDARSRHISQLLKLMCEDESIHLCAALLLREIQNKDRIEINRRLELRAEERFKARATMRDIEAAKQRKLPTAGEHPGDERLKALRQKLHERKRKRDEQQAVKMEDARPDDPECKKTDEEDVFDTAQPLQKVCKVKQEEENASEM